MRTYSDYLKQYFPGIKVQKLSVDAGFSCPNRDGTISTGGCIYCRNDSFTPGYCNKNDSVTLQLDKGKKFFSRKYPDMKFLAYFQSYTGTYGRSYDKLKSLYQEALEQDDILGLIIATRPDSLSDEVINILKELNREKPIFIELGAETSHDHTLKLINRNHTWADVVCAVRKISEANIHCGLHLIAGLPSENKKMIIDTIVKACELPIETIKLHQLQILFGTQLYERWQADEIEVAPYSLEDYLDLCAEIVGIVPDNIIIERFLSQSPPELVAAPKWGLKNYQFANLLDKRIRDLKK